MEKGNLRCDANVSIREKGSSVLNTKTEIKNVNSIDAVKEAIRKEIERQIREVSKGNTIKAWTLDWDDNAGVLRMMRSKETEADYRYFHEPDLLPLEVSKAWQDRILKDMPELPLERRARFMQEFNLPEYDADILTGERELADYFEETVNLYKGDAKKISNWLMNDVLRMRNEMGISMTEMKLSPAHLAELVRLTDDGKINITTAKNLLPKIQESGKSPQMLVEELGLAVVSDAAAIRAICEKIVAQNPSEVKSYRDGKESLMGWFVGQVMREMRGKADPKVTQAILQELLNQ
jgi:aspartyl-tRNA(Asn)/glutamyl-tRNA(Gln) amidotransferase subunit B